MIQSVPENIKAFFLEIEPLRHPRVNHVNIREHQIGLFHLPDDDLLVIHIGGSIERIGFGHSYLL